MDDLIADGFRQVSRKLRKLARLPAGKTGLEALSEVHPELAQHFLDTLNQRAAEHYMRVYAKGEEVVELSPAEFQEYLDKTR